MLNVFKCIPYFFFRKPNEIPRFLFLCLRSKSFIDAVFVACMNILCSLNQCHVHKVSVASDGERTEAKLWGKIGFAFLTVVSVWWIRHIHSTLLSVHRMLLMVCFNLVVKNEKDTNAYNDFLCLYPFHILCVLCDTR